MVLAVGAAGTVMLLTRDRSVGSLLGSHPVSAAASAESLTPTRLVALPPHTIANGTEPLTVTLSAPPGRELAAPDAQARGRGHVEHGRRLRGVHARLDADAVLDLHADRVGGHDRHRPLAPGQAPYGRPERRVPADRGAAAGARAPGLHGREVPSALRRPHRCRPRDAPRSGRARVSPAPRRARARPLRRPGDRNGTARRDHARRAHRLPVRPRPRTDRRTELRRPGHRCSRRRATTGATPSPTPG